MAERDDIRLTNREQAALNALLDPDAKLKLVVPKSIETKDLWERLDLCCRAWNIAKRTTDRIEPIVGRLLLLVRDRPDTYRDHGFTNFEDFLKRQVREVHGISRTQAYDMMNVAEAFPSIQTERAEKIGTSKLRLLTRAGLREKETGTKVCEEWLNKAETRTIDQLRVDLERKKLLEKGESIGGVVVIKCSRAIERQWKKLAANPAAHAVLGCADEGRLFEALMQEWEGTYLKEGEDAVAAREPLRRVNTGD